MAIDHATRSSTRRKPTNTDTATGETPGFESAAPAPMAGLAFSSDAGGPDSGGWLAGAALMDEPIRRSAAGSDPLGGTAVRPEVNAALRRRRGRGSALAPEVAASLGEAMNADFSDVRVHTDPEADSIARSVQAHAFTQGSDLYFTAGTYSPGTPSGQHLLAHELTHVVQQRSGGGSSGGATIGRADDPVEAEADRTASRVVGALRRKARSAPAGPSTEPPRRSALGALTRIARTAVAGGLQIMRDVADVAKKIANGHSFTKHKAEFSGDGITDVTKFEAHVASVMGSGTKRALSGGREAYYDAASNTVVIYNPSAADNGTCFKPTNKKSYFDNLA